MDTLKTESILEEHGHLIADVHLEPGSSPLATKWGRIAVLQLSFMMMIMMLLTLTLSVYKIVLMVGKKVMKTLKRMKTLLLIKMTLVHLLMIQKKSRMPVKLQMTRNL